MSLDSFLSSLQAKPSQVTGGSFVEAQFHSVDSAGLYFTVKAWDDGKHVFGPAPWAVSPFTPAVGERLLVLFLGSGVGNPWVLGLLDSGIGDTVPVAGGTMTGRLVVETSNEASLTSNADGSIRVGTQTGQHLAIDNNEIQSKATATTAGALDLQPHGGLTNIGGGLSVTASGIVVVSGRISAPHAAVTLAGLTGSLVLGSIANGAHLAMSANEVQAKATNTTAATLFLNPLGGVVRVGDGNPAGSILQVGNDAVLEDVNVANTMRLRGVADSTQGILYLSTNNRRLEASNARLLVSDGASKYIDLNTAGGFIDLINATPGGAVYVNGDTIYLRSAAGVERARINSAGIIADSPSSIAVGASTAGVHKARFYGGGTSIEKTMGSAVWSDSQLIIQSIAAGFSQLALHNNNGQAPIICQDTGSGERILFLNNARSAWIPLLALSFNVMSTERAKNDIQPLAGADALAVAKAVKPIRFKRKVAIYTRPNDRFRDLDQRWQGRGHSPLTVKPEHMEPDPDRPNLEEFGVSAEQLANGVLPAAVQYDEHGDPVGVDVAQLASVALASAGELARIVEAQAKLISELTDRVAALELGYRS